MTASSFNGEISGWDVSSVEDMEGIFADASSFNQPLNSWNVSSVKNMGNMFSRAFLFDQPLDSWNVSNVERMKFMFAASAFNQPLNSWDVSSVETMENMFAGASFNQPLNFWNVSSVENMREMFIHASAFNQPLDEWDVSQASSMESMFDGADEFDQNLGRWYATLDRASIDREAIPGAVGTISAQNAHLAGHNPAYGIGTGGDSDRFAITDGNRLNMTSAVSGRSSYTVNVTASGPAVFEDGNNWRTLEITVNGDTTGPEPRALLPLGRPALPTRP